ncbi:zinc-ribbon domain-containing protein [Tabrizicola thermarum]|uniref:zinc-ribbon domain-containing protein n=1 Tax=Tabrizicola thermarum TaxID=2670345 RepID=UPI000FFBDFF3|nr:zinc-ribbon domain-containing protein [Tabrizicola thermarum]
MRLVCPNCEAKYEVPEDAIPETGRDVQCANCGHAWYQMRPRAAVAEPVAVAPVVPPPSVSAPEPAPAPAPELGPQPQPERAPVESDPPVAPDVVAAPEAPVDPVPAAPVEDTAEPVPEPVPDPVTAAVAVADPGTAEPAAPAAPEAAAADPVATSAPDATDEDETEAEAPAPLAEAGAAAPAAFAVDESVLAILREEAEREAQARKAEAARPLEVQPDLGLVEVAAPKKPVEVISVDEPVPAAAAAESDDRLGLRKARLPDVEEINSTLRPVGQLAEESEDEAPAPVAEGGSSFRSGFLLVMVIAILGAALYISADALAQAVPALAGVLKSYVGFVDNLRLQLDGLMQSATVAINGSGG